MPSKHKVHFARFCFVISFLFASCTTLNNVNGVSNRLTLSMTEQMKPGITTKDEISNRLGKPDRIAPFKNKLDEAWLYLNDNKDSTRVSFIFDGNSTLIRTSWFPNNNEPEFHLKNALARYEPNTFVRTQQNWSSHGSLNREVYKNSSIGIDIVNGLNDQVIQSIEFTIPSSRSSTHK